MLLTPLLVLVLGLLLILLLGLLLLTLLLLRPNRENRFPLLQQHLVAHLLLRHQLLLHHNLLLCLKTIFFPIASVKNRLQASICIRKTGVLRSARRKKSRGVRAACG